MFKMFAQLFSAVTVFFGATEKLANAANHIAGWAEDSAAAFEDEARVQRKIKLNKLNKELAESEPIKLAA